MRVSLDGKVFRFREESKSEPRSVSRRQANRGMSAVLRSACPTLGISWSGWGSLFGIGRRPADFANATASAKAARVTGKSRPGREWFSILPSYLTKFCRAVRILAQYEAQGLRRSAKGSRERSAGIIYESRNIDWAWIAGMARIAAASPPRPHLLPAKGRLCFQSDYGNLPAKILSATCCERSAT